MNQKTMISITLMAALTIAIVSTGISTVNAATLVIKSNTKWSGSIMDSGFDMASQDGSGNQNFEVDCSQGMKIYSTMFQKQDESGSLTVSLIQDGNMLDTKTTTAAYGVVSIAGNCN